MADYRVLTNTATGVVLLPRLRLCKDFFSKFRGLMLRSDLPETDGLMFVYGRESRVDTSIHMLFMAFPIAVVWLDKDNQVIDKALAKVWRPAYAPRTPAQYVIEARPSLLDRVAVGDRLSYNQPSTLSGAQSNSKPGAV